LKEVAQLFVTNADEREREDFVLPIPLRNIYNMA